MKMTVSKAVLAMALMTGCGGVGLRGVEESPPDHVGTTSTSQALEVDLRMRGTGAQDYTNLLLVPGSIEVRADGVLLPVTLDRDRLQDDSIALTVDRHLSRAETELSRKSNRLAAAGPEHLGPSRFPGANPSRSSPCRASGLPPSRAHGMHLQYIS